MDILDIRREPLDIASVFPKFSSYFLNKYRFESKNTHLMIEQALVLLHEGNGEGIRELFDVYGLTSFKDSCCQWNFGLGLMLLANGCVSVHLLHSYRLLNFEGQFIPAGSPREECVLGVLHDDFEYLVSAKHIFVDGKTTTSSLEQISIISGTVYLKRMITDSLRSKNSGWDPVTFPVWIKALDNVQVYYKVHERVPLFLTAVADTIEEKS